jgi:hypothetical protein
MGKHQYYEFQAGNRGLFGKEIGELRIDCDLIEADSKLRPALEQTMSDNTKETRITDILESLIKGDPPPSLRRVQRFNKNWQSNKVDTLKPQYSLTELLKEAESIILSRRRKEEERTAAEQKLCRNNSKSRNFDREALHY